MTSPDIWDIFIRPLYSSERVGWYMIIARAQFLCWNTIKQETIFWKVEVNMYSKLHFLKWAGILVPAILIQFILWYVDSKPIEMEQIIASNMKTESLELDEIIAMDIRTSYSKVAVVREKV